MSSRTTKGSLFVALHLACSSGIATAGCPTGSYPWIDGWGNEICKRYGDGSTATIQPRRPGCPAGSHPWVDSWGNQVCQSFDGGDRYYDTSRGCPTGSYPWIDGWGNRTCRFF